MTPDTSDRDAKEYDPFEYVPDRIDQVTASGLVQLHDALNDENAATLRSQPIEDQARLLWKLTETDAIDLTIRPEADR